MAALHAPYIIYFLLVLVVSAQDLQPPFLEEREPQLSSVQPPASGEPPGILTGSEPGGRAPESPPFEEFEFNPLEEEKSIESGKLDGEINVNDKDDEKFKNSELPDNTYPNNRNLNFKGVKTQNDGPPAGKKEEMQEVRDLESVLMVEKENKNETNSRFDAIGTAVETTIKEEDIQNGAFLPLNTTITSQTFHNASSKPTRSDAKIQTSETSTLVDSDLLEVTTTPNQGQNPDQNASQVPSPSTLKCPSSNQLPTFIRHSHPTFLTNKKGVLVKPNFVRKMQSLEECAEICRQNIEPFSGEPFQCYGFTYASRNTDNSCEFYVEGSLDISKPSDDDHSSPSTPKQRLAFFERICLVIPAECSKSIFSFETHPRKFLPIIPIETINAEDQVRCMDFCLTNPNCKSVNYHKINGSCEVMDRAWRTVTGGLQDHEDYDYYENICFQEKNRCSPQSRIDFLVTKNTELDAFDVAVGEISVRNCMRRCIESETLFCRSFQYDHSTRECYLAIEGYEQVVQDTSSGTSTITAVTASEILDLFEPVCLDEAIDLPCTGDSVFERLINMNLLTEGDPIDAKELPQSTVEACMDACLHNVSCLSFTFARNEQHCRLLSFDRSFNFTLPILETHIDYYELSCARDAILKSETSLSTSAPELSVPTETTILSTTSATPTTITATITEPLVELELTTISQEPESVESASPPSPVVICDTPRSILIERGRTLRLEYRNLHHVNVHDFNQCEALCESAPINCVTFAYNGRSNDCLLSTTHIDRNSRFTLLTQPNINYDLYNFVGTSCQTADRELSTFATTPASTTTIALPKSTFVPRATTKAELPANIKEFTATVLLEQEELVPGQITSRNNTVEAENGAEQGQEAADQFHDEERDEEEETTETESSQVPKPVERLPSVQAEPVEFIDFDDENIDESETFKERSEDTKSTDFVIDSDQIAQTNDVSGPNKSESVVQSKEDIGVGDVIEDDASGHKSIPHAAPKFRPQIPRRVAHMRRVQNSKVKVSAMCMPNGVNVTFNVLGGTKYTGAVYAAERFSQCRIFVEEKQEFALFIHRPNVNNWCNALESEGELSAILVMSNDMVLPYDVTTKDDFFYEISCEYDEDEAAGPDESKELHSGIVVGGPEPRFIMAERGSTNGRKRPFSDNMQTRVGLKILRNGRPVSSVYIGERLTAVIDSDIDVNRLSIADCNATRVGGRQPKPNSVQLIDNGCTLMPQIIGNMVRGKHGLEAPLTAFRIDGSDQIDIVCSVIVCRTRCKEKLNKCPVIRTRRAPLPAPKSSEDNQPEITISDEDDMITVDHRLKVMVTDEDDPLSKDSQNKEEISKASTASTHHIRQSDANALLRFFDIDTRNGSEYCLNPTLLFATLILFIVCLIALIISLSTHWCRRKSNQSALSAIYPPRPREIPAPMTHFIDESDVPLETMNEGFHGNKSSMGIYFLMPLDTKEAPPLLSKDFGVKDAFCATANRLFFPRVKRDGTKNGSRPSSAICYCFIYLCLVCKLISGISGEGQRNCQSIYVRWPRVKLNLGPAKQGPYSQAACRDACTNNEDPGKSGTEQQCSAYNHRAGPNQYTHECQIFQRDNVQHTDGHIEADDRYTFYWKYCVKSDNKCDGEYAFTFFSDRYMAESEIGKTVYTRTLEDCLAVCLNEEKLMCRSVSFNRTDGGCQLSEQNQLSKPSLIKINNNPNFRIDYYESNCVNNSFVFTHKCEEKGIQIEVDSKLPYTGALYGLYDFFSCRIEPKESKHFGLMFPYPTLSKNCSDSMRYAGSDLILEVVLSTDGVEPLYFITSDDLTYQAKCPVSRATPVLKKDPNKNKDNTFSFQDSQASNTDSKTKSPSEQTVRTTQRQDQTETVITKSQTVKVTESSSASTSTTPPETTLKTLKPVTKDVFSLPPYTPTPGVSDRTNWNDIKVDQVVKDQTANPSQTSTTGEFSTKSQTQVSDEPSTRSEVRHQQTRSPGQITTSDEILSKSQTTTSNGQTTTSNQITVQTQTPISGQTTDQTKNQSSTTTSAATRISTETPRAPISELNTTKISLAQEKGLKTSRHRGLEPITDISQLRFRDENNRLHNGTGDSEPKAVASVREVEVRDESRLGGLVSSERGEGGQKMRAPGLQRTDFSFNTQLKFPGPDQIILSATPNGNGHSMGTDIDGPSNAPPAPQVDPTSSPQPGGGSPPGSPREPPPFNRNSNQAVIFDVFHNGQPAEAVVVGSRITLSFTPFYAIPPAYMSISGCQVEPIGSLYEWEKEPLAIIKDGCQADHVGLVCPPQRTDYGIRVTVESFRYQTTTQVQYTCLIRICPFAPCPQTTCSAVEGCPGDDIISRSFGLRAKRHLSLDQIRAALAANPYLQQQLTLGATQANPANSRMNNSLQHQLIALGGDHIVRKRLIVVNTEEELHYYVKTGEVPNGHLK
ncbi:PAN domain-containing protein [Ditylenchus destructor]|uniref:PAN domain-containing protein n=1 Tax=Ditylenchus destructor TaxID=166010 RepID=A0AAD4QY50_9BILA|nr:PAN domain-containing protein [Ditylenchus destructor]